jgi:flavin-binding protein dodecin
MKNPVYKLIELTGTSTTSIEYDGNQWHDKTSPT